MRWAVILAGLAFVLAQSVCAQSAAGKKAPKGPRALGLVQLLPNGKARLIPVTILYDGEFYDASAYKAAPVPMALESGTVYEGVRTGVSQGLFTVSSALQGNNTWVGDGTWQTASAIAAAKDAAAKKKAIMSKPAPEPVEGPPVLRRANAKPPKASEDAPAPAPAGPAPASSTPPTSASAPAASTPPVQDSEADSDRPVLKRPTSATAPADSTPATAPETEEDPDRPVLKRPAEAAAPAASTPAAASEPEEDPNRPVLKRGKPTAEELKKRNAAVSATASPATAKDAHKPAAAASTGTPNPLQLIPAISDAAGPDPRPYAYSLKPEEEPKLRNKMLTLAGDEVRAWAAQPGQSAGSQAAPRASRPGTRAKPPQATFADVQLHAFDLSNSNEPVVVLTAKAQLPLRPNTSSDLQYVITLVAREDMYGDLHKVFASVTDSQHFDVLSKLELIDAVDADGDGRGELLFRQVSDAGSAFVLYRVIGDRLWPLFQGTPGQ